MADAFTPYWGLTQPEVGASRDTWGGKLNDDMTALDTLLQALQPIGAMTDFAGANAPVGWLLCDGTLYQVSSYPRLFAVIGSTYGGDGISTFAVPDLRARSTAGVGATVGDLGFTIQITLGEKIGDSSVVIQQANLPSAATITTTAAGGHNHPGSATNVGGNHVHTGQTDFGGSHNHGMPAQVAWHNGGQDAAGGPDSGITSGVTTTDGNHAHPFATTVNGDHQHNLTISTDGVHNHSFSLGGSDAPMRTMPPLFGTTKIICCGPPSMQTLPGGLTPMNSPLRGIH